MPQRREPAEEAPPREELAQLGGDIDGLIGTVSRIAETPAASSLAGGRRIEQEVLK